MVLWLLACGGGGGLPGNAVGASGYGTLSAESAWTWREELPADTGVSLDVDESGLIHGRFVDGAIELRRGSRWADATTVGEIRLAAPEGGGLVLDGWSFDEATGGGALLSLEDPETGVDTPDCGIVTDLEVDTFYGVFQRTLISDCGGKGEWVFEYGVGLIQVETEGLVLDLVAPY